MKPTVETKICELVKRGHLLSSEVSDENTEILRSPGCSGQNECQFAAGQALYFAECIRKGVQS